jgi:UDP-GlcNAc:undecaprenyl-phosphate GlcNAc-1-phosphate transferase
VILWTWTLLLSAFVLYPTLTGRNPTYLPFGIIALGIVLFTVLHPSVRARRRVNEQNGSSLGADGDAGG